MGVAAVPSCPQCRTESRRILVREVTDRFRADDRYLIARCGSCGLAFTYPNGESYPDTYEPYLFQDSSSRTRGTRAAILRAFYQGRGTWGERAVLLIPWLFFRLRDRMKVRAREVYAWPFRRRGRLLDVGCGSGDTLKSWIGQHDECVGLETDPRAADIARKRLGVDVRCGTLEEQRFPGDSFDVVTLSHVLEHVPNPRETIRRCSGLLRPGGELLIWVPNFESPLRKFFGAVWFPYEVPRHRWHFRPGDVVRLLREAGLSVVEIAPDASESTFRKSARRSRAWPALLLRRRAVRILFVLACRLARRADVVRVRAVKK